MTTPYPGAVPDPETNRAQWLAAHPEAQPVDPGTASDQVAAQLGAAAPGPGVSGQALGEQMAAQGAHAGLPHEAAMDALMQQIKALSEQVGFLQRRDQLREAAAIAALGEPIMTRYAKSIRDHLAAHEAANPGLGPDHFAGVRATAADLVAAVSDAITAGGNDLGRVRYHAALIEHFLERGHRRKAPAHLVHIDMSAIGQSLEYLTDEVARLSGSAVTLAG